MSIKLRFTLFISIATILIIGVFSWSIYSLVKTEMLRQASLSLGNFLKHESEHILHPNTATAYPVEKTHFGDFLVKVTINEKILYNTINQKQYLDDASLFLVSSLSKTFEGKTYTLTGVYDLAPVNTYLKSLFRILILGCVLAIILLFPIGFVLSFILLKPFRTLAQETSRLKADTLGFRFPSSSKNDEYGLLATSFNSLFDRLEHSFSQMKKFAGNVSHEIRTPISIILSQTEIALRKERTVLDYKLALEKCLNEALRLRHTVENLLSLSEIERIHKERQISKISVARKTDEIIQGLKVRFGNEKKVSLSCDKNLEYVGNEVAFWSVCSNLIENAMKYSRSQIEVTAMEQGDSLVIIVNDDGPGFPNPDVTDLPNMPSLEKGYGLGLSITRAFLNAYGGDLAFRRSELGGTSAVASLPNRTENCK